MRLEKLPSGSFRATQMYKGKRYRITFDHKPTAKEVNIAISEKLQDNEVEIRGSFEKAAREYIDDRRNVLSPSSVITYERLINAISKEFKNTNLYDVDQALVQREINLYAKSHAPKTVRALHGFISAVMGSYRPQMVLRTTLPQKKPKESYLPTQDDIKAILDSAKGTEDSIGFQLGVLSLRRGEICALDLSDLKGNELHVHATMVWNKKWIKKEAPKTDAGNRIVYLPDSLVKEIKSKGYFFKYSANKLNDHLHKYQKELGIPRFRFHDLRHYFASYASTIMSEADAMALGGWKSDHIFKQVYRESMADKRKSAAEKYLQDMF